MGFFVMITAALLELFVIIVEKLILEEQIKKEINMEPEERIYETN